MHYDESGDFSKPALVCVPGLFGGPSDFAPMRAAWDRAFHVITLDPDRDRRKSATANIPVRESEELFVSTADAIRDILAARGKTEAFVVGVSLGSKVVFDFAIKHPALFAGGLSMDVGCGPFEETDLYRFIDGMVDHLDLSIPFPEMKKVLAARIPDRNLRTMIQTQLFYPEGKPPARWKSGMRHLGAVLSETMKKQGIDAQFDGLARVDAALAARGKYIQVLRATNISAIDAAAIPRMNAFACVRMETVEGASHFLHVTHQELVTASVLRMAAGRAGEVPLTYW